MFIGSKEIKSSSDNEKGELVVSFVDGTDTAIRKDLYELIKSEKIGTGNVTDNINDFFARKFLAELAFYELGFYFSTNIGTSMGVLAHNLREELLRKTFKCSGGDDINLKLLTGVESID